MSRARHEALLLDEMFSPAIAEELRRRGYHVIAVAADPELRALTDSEVFEWAAVHRRRIVTENVKDFRLLIIDSGDATSPGVLFTSSRTFRRSRRSMGLIVSALEQWLSQSGERHAEEWLDRAKR